MLNSLLQTFETGIDHPLVRKRDGVNFKEPSVAFIQSKLGAIGENTAFHSGYSPDVVTHACAKQTHEGISFVNTVANVAFNKDGLQSSFVTPCRLLSLYNTFRKTQDALLAGVDPTKRQESGRGNVWYLNEISDSIKKDMSNPFTRSGMALYPDAGSKLGEIWYGDKMLRESRHPRSSTIYYVNELFRCTEDRWFIPALADAKLRRSDAGVRVSC